MSLSLHHYTICGGLHGNSGRAKIILTPIPQANGAIKNRPALVLRKMPKYQDLLVCGISTQLKQYIADFDEIIAPNDNDFESSGLISPSVIRLSFLTVIPNKNVIGAIGNISIERYQRLIANLVHYLTQNEYS